jgi:hypothetical protein
MFGRHRVNFIHCDNLDLVGERIGIGFQLGAHGLIRLACMLTRCIDQMQQHTTSLDVTEETIAETCTFMRAFDEAWNIRQYEFAIVDAHHAELRMQCCERIVRDLWLRCAND